MKCNYCGKTISEKDYQQRKCSGCGKNPFMKQGSLIVRRPTPRVLDGAKSAKK